MLSGKNKYITILSIILITLVICIFQLKTKAFNLNSGVFPFDNIRYKSDKMDHTKKMAYLYVGGSLVYCMEPEVTINSNLNYSCNYNHGYSEEEMAEIELITAYGYNYPGHGSKEYYIAAQELIWEVLGQETTFYDRTDKNIINFDSFKDEIKRLMNDNNKRPNFGSQPKIVEAGKEYRFEDSNKVLAEYKVSSAKPNTARIEGNILIVTINNSSPKSSFIKLIRKSAIIDQPSAICNSTLPGFQQVFFPGTANGESILELNVEGGTNVIPKCSVDPNPNRVTHCGSPTQFNNAMCTVKSSNYYDISCSDTLIFNSIKDSPHITAGEGFSYDNDVYGNRKCKGTFNASKWQGDWTNTNNIIRQQHNIYVNRKNRTINAGGCVDTYLSPKTCPKKKPNCRQTEYCVAPRMTVDRYDYLVLEMENAEKRRDQADQFKSSLEDTKNYFEEWTNNYIFEPKLSITIKENGKTTNLKMLEFIKKEVNNHRNDGADTSKNNYGVTTCTFSEEQNAQCWYESPSLYNKWERISFVEAVYKLPRRYIKKDSLGTVVNSNCQGCIDGGYKYYTNFTTPTGDYDITLKGVNLGHKKRWTVIDNCSYHIDNIVTPTPLDPNYGNVFLYRPISLFDPFPNNREAGPNWLNKEHLITDTATTLYNNVPEFVVTLTPSDIRSIRVDNASKKVGSTSEVYTEYVNNSSTYDPKKPYKSKFIWTTFRNLFNIRGGA